MKNKARLKRLSTRKLLGWRKIRFAKFDNESSSFLTVNSQDASAEDLKAQKKEMEDIVQPIIAKLYQGQGGPPPEGGEEEDDEFKDEL